jgi:hypothetical protein
MACPPLAEPATDGDVAARSDALLELNLQHAQERIVDLTQQLERALCDVADWKEQAKRIALLLPVPAPVSATESAPAQPLWRRVRAF